VFLGEGTLVPRGMVLRGPSDRDRAVGRDVQILENTVLHLLPDNTLVIDDGAIVGPGAMIHGCHIGARSVVEPGAIVCDGSVVGADSVVRAGAVVKQRSHFADGRELDGSPATGVGVRPGRAPAPRVIDCASRPLRNFDRPSRMADWVKGFRTFSPLL
jgi:carbonic anhydrase/acetyltransferase-like protein (isoleucine patch superfamily)